METLVHRIKVLVIFNPLKRTNSELEIPTGFLANQANQRKYPSVRGKEGEM